MKLSCIPICFFDDIISTGKMSLSEWIETAADVGLDGIEMYRPYLKTTEQRSLEKLADEISQARLEVSMFTGYGELAAPSEKERLAQIESLREDVDAAVAFRTNIVRVTAGSWPQECSREEALSHVADCLKRGLDYAEEKGVMLALEDHPQIGTSVADFVEILALVDDSRLKVNLDTSNPMESGDSAVELAQMVKERVVHVHASDRDRQLEHQVVGEGGVPFAEIFEALKSANFDGWISLEAGGTKGKQGIVEGMRHIRDIWGG